MWADLILIVAIALITVGIALTGAITPVHAVLAMVGLVILLPLLRRKGGRILSTLLIVFVVIAFIVWYGGGGEDMIPLVGSFFAIVIVLFGFYIMFRGFRGSRSDRRRCDDD